MSFYFLEATAFAKLFVREPGTDALIRLLEKVEDNRKLISAATPLEIYSALRRRERAGAIAPEDVATALEVLRIEAARMVQQPLNPGILEAARQLLDRTTLRWPDALQLGSALAARDMFPGTAITFVSSSAVLLDAANAEGLETIDPVKLPPAETKTSAEAGRWRKRKWPRKQSPLPRMLRRSETPARAISLIPLCAAEDYGLLPPSHHLYPDLACGFRHGGCSQPGGCAGRDPAEQRKSG